MEPGLPRTRLIESVRERCRGDARVVAALQYGSFGKGEGDRFSDVEFYIFVADPAVDGLDPEAWVSAVAPLHAFFVNEYGTHVAIFADSLVRGEFHFEPHAGVRRVRGWRSLERGGSPERMLLLDRLGDLAPILRGVSRVPLSADVVQACWALADDIGRELAALQGSEAERGDP